RLFDGRIACPAAVGADVEIRQPAVEQEGNMRADRMAVIEDGHTVDRLHALDFGQKRGMIGRMEPLQPERDIGRIGTLSLLPYRPAVEIRLGDEAGGVLSGIEACAGRIPVRVRSEEHTSELQSRENLVCRLLLEKKK